MTVIDQLLAELRFKAIEMVADLREEFIRSAVERGVLSLEDARALAATRDDGLIAKLDAGLARVRADVYRCRLN